MYISIIICFLTSSFTPSSHIVPLTFLKTSFTSSSSSSYSFNVRDPKTHTVFQASVLARVGPPVIFLQAQRSCAISSFIPIAFMSLLTQLLHVFLGAPLSTTPITFILVHFFTQLFSSFRSTCPNHLNLPLCILFSTHSMPKRFKSSSLRFLSFKDTPHILLTIILSALLNLRLATISTTSPCPFPHRCHIDTPHSQPTLMGFIRPIRAVI